MSLNRREFIAAGAAGAGAIALGPLLSADALAATATAAASPYGPLGPPDSNDVALPQGFTSRIVARGLSPVPGTSYSWPIFSDGQAVFRTGDGGWVLVTNSESLSVTGAGSSAIRFGPAGEIVDAYRILGGTNVNCAGGPTPWGTWLSCEETDAGLVWESDPAGVLGAEPRPALGAFKHEAVAVDPVGGHLYLTEDSNPAGFYRFAPDAYPDLSTGILEVASVRPGGKVRWLRVPDPSTATSGTPTAAQVPEMTPFKNGEGIWYARGHCYFTTKTDKKVWDYDVARRRIDVLFDRELALDSSLDAVDNVTVSAVGDVLVCEDGGNLEIGLITSDREVSPLLRLEGPNHSASEICGACFDPSGTRLYFTSQRGFAGSGAVYEVSGPFRRPQRGVPADLLFGPPAGELRPSGPLNPGGDGAAPKARVKAARRLSRSALLERGAVTTVSSDEAASVAVLLDSAALVRTPGKGGSTDRPANVVLARARGRLERGTALRLRLRPGARARRLLGRERGSFDARLLVSVVDAAGNERILTRRVGVGGAR